MKLSYSLQPRSFWVSAPVVFLLLFSVGLVFAQTNEGESDAELGLTSEFRTRPLEIRISINLVTEDGHIIMKMDRSEPTIPGRAVGAILEQENQLRVEALFTAFWETETNLTLHAQGQVWVADSSQGYDSSPMASAYRAVPVALGDGVLFFPLGVPEQARGWDSRRFQFRTEPIAVERQLDPDGEKDGQHDAVAIVIVMAVQIVPYEPDDPAGLPSRIS